LCQAITGHTPTILTEATHTDLLFAFAVYTPPVLRSAGYADRHTITSDRRDMKFRSLKAFCYVTPRSMKL
jgi:hypothetical protein